MTPYRRTLNADYTVRKKYMESGLLPLEKETVSRRDPLDRAHENIVCGDLTQPKACWEKAHEVNECDIIDARVCV